MIKEHYYITIHDSKCKWSMEQKKVLINMLNEKEHWRYAVTCSNRGFNPTCNPLVMHKLWKQRLQSLVLWDGAPSIAHKINLSTRTSQFNGNKNKCVSGFWSLSEIWIQLIGIQITNKVINFSTKFHAILSSNTKSENDF